MKILEYNSTFWAQLKNRLNSEAFPPEKLQLVREIIAEVRMRGDRALRMFTLRFDGVDIKSFSVTTTEFRSAKKTPYPAIRRSFSGA